MDQREINRAILLLRLRSFSKHLPWLIMVLFLITIFAIFLVAKWPQGKATEVTAIIQESSMAQGGSGFIAVCLLPDGKMVNVVIPGEKPDKGRKILLMQQSRLLLTASYVFSGYVGKDSFKR